MQLQPVNSSAIRAVSYDGHTMAVLFHTSNTVYDHPGVPPSVFDEFMREESKGTYYNKNIRGKYR
ncbi:MAG: KTSC domain-containing protein [Verrucomicrobiota bacterium]